MGTLTRGNLDERLKDLGAHLRDLGVGLVDEARARGVDATIDQYPYTPATMIASDGEVPVFGEASPHPRSYGTFVRVLGRDLKTITLEEAVRQHRFNVSVVWAARTLPILVG
jgi:hypothetical protein